MIKKRFSCTSSCKIDSENNFLSFFGYLHLVGTVSGIVSVTSLQLHCLSHVLRDNIPTKEYSIKQDSLQSEYF